MPVRVVLTGRRGVKGLGGPGASPSWRLVGGWGGRLVKCSRVGKAVDEWGGRWDGLGWGVWKEAGKVNDTHRGVERVLST